MLQISRNDKLFIITRQDLAPGYQVAQSCHALRQFAFEYPEIDSAWFQRSNYLACLSAKNEDELLKLIDRAVKRGVRFSIFFEPDLDYEITAVALEPGLESKRLCSNYGLALREKKAA